MNPSVDRNVQRWAVWTAHAAALVALPSSLWRVGLALGLPLGYTEQGLRDLIGPGTLGPVALIGLSVLAEVAAVLTLALVHRWGEVVPGWVPRLGGRTIPARAVVVPSWIAVAAHALLWTPFLYWWQLPHPDMTGTGRFVVGFLYLPLVAWAPLMAAATVAYQRRRAAWGRRSAQAVESGYPQVVEICGWLCVVAGEGLVRSCFTGNDRGMGGGRRGGRLGTGAVHMWMTPPRRPCGAFLAGVDVLAGRPGGIGR
ncbi:hypothetical protein [Actinomadura sp. 21ATH]|uniref:hypothetical protein n=1 Tax=Actinomadura sp. 21ATH TaxID=1735444 RepID=UPI0035C04D6A